MSLEFLLFILIILSVEGAFLAHVFLKCRVCGKFRLLGYGYTLEHCKKCARKKK